MRFVNDHPFADADVAARKIVELANDFGRSRTAEYKAGLDRAQRVVRAA